MNRVKARCGRSWTPRDPCRPAVVRGADLHRPSPASGTTQSSLTRAEVDVLRLLADGYDLRSVAAALGCPTEEVEARLVTACRRTGVATPVQAVVLAVHVGLI